MEAHLHAALQGRQPDGKSALTLLAPDILPILTEVYREHIMSLLALMSSAGESTKLRTKPAYPAAAATDIRLLVCGLAPGPCKHFHQEVLTVDAARLVELVSFYRADSPQATEEIACMPHS